MTLQGPFLLPSPHCWALGLAVSTAGIQHGAGYPRPSDDLCRGEGRKQGELKWDQERRGKRNGRDQVDAGLQRDVAVLSWSTEK